MADTALAEDLDDADEAPPEEPVEEVEESEPEGDDAEGEGGEEAESPDDPAEGEAEGDEPPAPAAKPISKQSRRIVALKERTDRAETETRELRERLDRIERDRQQQGNAEQERIERDRVSLMTPEERVSHESGKLRSEFQRSLAGIQFREADRDDKADFRDAIAGKPHLAKYGAQVEERLQELRTKNFVNVPRIRVLQSILGEAVMNNGGKAITTAKAKAKARTQSQTTRPTGARSDAAQTDRGKKQPTARERLEGVNFLDIKGR